MQLRALSLGGLFFVSINSGRHVLTIACVALLFAASAHAQVLTYQPELVKSIQLPSAAVISSDGKFVYVAKDFSLDAAAIEMYTRDTATGALTLPKKYDGISGLTNPWALTLNPDQTRLYAVNWGSRNGATFGDTLIVFKRDLATGVLTFVETHINNTNGVSGIAAPVSVTVSPNGSHVYVAGMDDHAVTLFVHNASGDGLTFVESYKNSVGNINALQKPTSVALSPDGTQLYVAASQSNAVVTFARDAATGKLQWQQALLDGANGIDGLAGAQAVVASADGKSVYVAGLGDDAIAVLARDVLTGMLSAAAPVKNGVDGVAGLTRVSALAMSADGSKLYAVSPVDNALTVFQRNPLTGALTLLESHVDNIKGVDGLSGVFTLAASSNGAHVYTVGTEGKLGIFQATVIDNNTAPIARNDVVIAVVSESVSIDVLKNDTDANVGDVIVVQNWDVLSPHKGTVDKLPDGTLRYTPAPGYVGLDNFSYTITDIQGATATAQVTVIMNTRPVATDDAVSMWTPKERAITILVTFNDSDVNVCDKPGVTYPDTNINVCDVLSVTAVDPVSKQGGAVEINLGSQYVTYTPVPGFLGVDTFSYTVTDDKGGRSSAWVTVTVNAAVTPPGNGLGNNLDTKKKKGGGSIEPWSLLCLVACIAIARAHRRRIV